MTILITPQKAAANSSSITVADNRSGTQERYDQYSTFRVIGILGTDEYVKLQYYDGTTWRDAVINANEAKILDEDNSVCSVYGRMSDMRVSKSITTTNVGVEII